MNRPRPFHRRHIHLDEGFHAPMSIRMVEFLVGGDATRQAVAVDAAIAAIEARLTFWDGVLRELRSQR